MHCSQGTTIVDTDPDGRCLFRAVFMGINQHAPRSAHEQQVGADDLRAASNAALTTTARVHVENTEHMDIHETIEEYVARMTPWRSYAEAPSVIALSVAINRAIVVMHPVGA
jgi:hypothetical protein